jgi:hypothetical protein
MALGGGGNTYPMQMMDTVQDRVRARDGAMRLLNRMTTGAAVSALVGVGVLGAVSAHTIPGATSTSTASTSTASASITSSSTSSSTSTSSSGLQSSTTPVTSSSSSGVAVSGGS